MPVEWNRAIEIESATLDTLIARFGVPAFVKVDVEGSELRVLCGLTQALRALSFEYLPTALPEARACLARVLELGPYRFNLSVGESYRLISTNWLAAEEDFTLTRLSATCQRSFSFGFGSGFMSSVG